MPKRKSFAGKLGLRVWMNRVEFNEGEGERERERRREGEREWWI